ncbi:MAG: sigma-70 family RNA polymerase sigma factor [Planctomycetes bacterium]|nr:sigma-70 family RNA polymerase sigma factor [Planctomycetota bacterium]
MTEPGPATLLLNRLRDGDADAAAELFPLVYDELHRLAARDMQRQPAGHTLQPTALVHEAFLKLVGRTGGASDRAHFFRLAAQAMRSVLVDHARGRRRAKRGGDALRVTLDEPLVAESSDARLPDLLDVDEALAELAAVDEPLVRIVELRFFAGLTAAEAADVLGVSSRTVERGWRTARAWLLARLSGGDADGDDRGGSA